LTFIPGECVCKIVYAVLECLIVKFGWHRNSREPKDGV
jgi:hypothetical protein